MTPIKAAAEPNRDQRSYPATESAELARRVESHVKHLANTSMNLPLGDWGVIANDLLEAARALRPGGIAQAELGPCTQAELDAGFDAKNALLVSMWMDRALKAEAAAQGAWQPIETAPKERWIIGYTSWGQQVGAFHEWVGPCEWITDHFEFTNTDFDVFPLPTHWQPWPAPRGAEVSSTDGGTP